jgi:hypothetical protein
VPIRLRLQLWTPSGDKRATPDDRWSNETLSFGNAGAQPFDILCAVWLDQSMIAASNKKGEICLFDTVKKRLRPKPVALRGV